MRELPWLDIHKPDQQSAFTYRLADVDHPYDFYWARNHNGDYAFRFRGHFPIERVQGIPDMSGIAMSSDEIEGWSYFNLVLESTENADIFLTLCNSLMRVTAVISPGEDMAAVDMLVNRLKRWQDLLKAAQCGTLSLDAQIGLFGELLVLRDLFLANLDPIDGVSCWKGPLGDEQDFGYSDSLVEVKTSRSTRDQFFSVSSLGQLDTSSGKITLVFQTVGAFDDSPPSGLSLNGLVEEIRAKLMEHSAALVDFDVNLALSKYVANPEYDNIHFVLVSRKLFDVSEGFPRIEPADVRSGVQKVKYVVAVDDCMDYELAPAEAIGRILKGSNHSGLQDIQIKPEELVRFEESSELEFKSSLRWSYSENKLNRTLEFVVLKTISALANSRGGHLVVGVDDHKNILGIEKDCQTLKSQKDRDGFEQHLSQLISSAFGSPFCANNIQMDFPIIDEKEICVVRVNRSIELQFVEKMDRSGKKSNTYFVRTGNSSRELTPDEIIEYDRVRNKS